MKTIRATKTKDGYYVVIKDTRHIHCKSDVLKFIKQQGLKVFGASADSEGNHIIIAN